jgi:hypothetical protein
VFEILSFRMCRPRELKHKSAPPIPSLLFVAETLYTESPGFRAADAGFFGASVLFSLHSTSGAV